MTADIKAIKERLEKITPGKWGIIDGEGTVIDHEGCEVWPWYRKEDMDFAYNAPQDIRTLLAEVERLNEELHDYRMFTDIKIGGLESNNERYKRKIRRMELVEIDLHEENERLRKALEEIDTHIRSTSDPIPHIIETLKCGLYEEESE